MNGNVFGHVHFRTVPRGHASVRTTMEVLMLLGSLGLTLVGLLAALGVIL
ncbi:Uncharacterised protein [Rhodococcus gordoniae]|uniref:Uncharacterized protein n=1 Tax=Rhodococcus gordoniae TaxID=223392 RepID=A0A379LZF4_9NOCA|nr:Uncharacterised protein [Rhodococcus gordoniae]